MDTLQVVLQGIVAKTMFETDDYNGLEKEQRRKVNIEIKKRKNGKLSKGVSERSYV